MRALEKKNFKLVIEYDGTALHGWQRQKNGRTVQAEIEQAISRMIRGQPVTVNGSGRTDAGVHALGQTASFHCITHLSAADFQNGLNSLLHADIMIRSCEEADASFHARYDAVSKNYQYRIINHPAPPAVGRQYALHIRKPLDLRAMTAAAACLVGTHDFKGFEGSGSPRSHTVRTVFSAAIAEKKNHLITFDIQADGFLRFMVRNVVGTLLEIGRGKMEPASVKTIIASRDRSRAGPTAPPHGLFLLGVEYGPK